MTPVIFEDKEVNVLSTQYLYIISDNPFFRITNEKYLEVEHKLHGFFPDSAEIGLVVNSDVGFFGSLESTEIIRCPYCQSLIDTQWWMIQIAHIKTDEDESLMVNTPCCGKKNSLNNYIFQDRAGLACSAVIVTDPMELRLGAEKQNELQKILGTNLRFVWACF